MPSGSTFLDWIAELELEIGGPGSEHRSFPALTSTPEMHMNESVAFGSWRCNYR